MLVTEFVKTKRSKSEQFAQILTPSLGELRAPSPQENEEDNLARLARRKTSIEPYSSLCRVLHSTRCEETLHVANNFDEIALNKDSL